MIRAPSLPATRAAALARGLEDDGGATVLIRPGSQRDARIEQRVEQVDDRVDDHERRHQHERIPWTTAKSLDSAACTR